MTAESPACEAARVSVELGARSYDILIGPGLLDRAGMEIAARMPGIRTAIVSDETVAGLYADTLQRSLAAAGIDSTRIVLPAGETTKRFDHAIAVSEAVLEARLERGDAVVALGGGVIGDLAGFVAGIVRRGMSFVQLPTSLLAQVDSSVGGKTGINTAHGKNLIGVFHQPALVLSDTGLLDTLSPREFRAGYARSCQIRPDRPAELLRLAGETLARRLCRRRRPCSGDRRKLPRQGRCGCRR